MTDLKETGLFNQAVQPWEPAAGPTKDEEIRRERDRLLSSLANSDLGTIESRVALVLQKFPETRDNDISLAIRYWQYFEADIINEYGKMDLHLLHGLQPMMTLVRCRQRLQNDFGLFVGTRRTRAFRSEQQQEFHRYLAQKRSDDPEICFFLDETGVDTSGRFIGIGGICVLDYRSYEMKHAAIRHWRENRNWESTLHFADMDRSTEHNYLEMLSQLRRYRSGLVFTGYATISRGCNFATITSLLVQLVCDTLELADKAGCLGQGRSVRIIKEAAQGYDNLHLAGFEQEISQQLLRLFPDRVYLKEVVTLPKGREVLLECADTIAAAMKRRWESGRRIHKDRVAEAVMNVTGFEDAEDSSALYRLFQ